MLEYDFAEFLYQRGVPYEYEKECIKLVENQYGYKRKIPDFIVNNNLVEITGLAYPKWVEGFQQKIQTLKESTDKRIILITYPDKVELLQHLKDERTFILSYLEISENIHIFRSN